MELKHFDQNILGRVAALIDEADYILIGAGAGMSAAAGIDYTDTDRFARLFPMMHKRGFTNNYQLMGYQGLDDSIMWGYLAMNVKHVGYEMQEHPVYKKLYQIVRQKDYFVITSNVDRMFYKNHFDEHKIYTPQGDYGRMQCLTPCTDQTWATRPFLDKLLNNLDPETHIITDQSAILKCPNCGGAMFMNVRGGNWFIDKDYQTQFKRLQSWLTHGADKKILLIELGSGFNTPGVIRYRFDAITRENPNATLIRVNKEHPDLPSEIRDKAISVKASIETFIDELHQRSNTSSTQ
jgi:NAD-dependent SIR2 family protein deacetylase